MGFVFTGKNQKNNPKSAKNGIVWGDGSRVSTAIA
jgi:hypothetical protein